jgi:hypothetical protein
MTALVLGSLLWLALSVVTVASFWYSVTWRDRAVTARCWLGNGCVCVVTEWLAGPGLPENSQWIWPRRPGWSLERREAGMHWSELCPATRYPYWGGTLVSVPLWMPVGGLGLALLCVRRSVSRRALPHHCLCGYDLTGNVSGRCPECGLAISRAARRRAGPERVQNVGGVGNEGEYLPRDADAVSDGR